MSESYRVWYCIKGYNGYEYSSDGLLRSMKNYKKYPYGYLIQRHQDKKGFYFFLSNNMNERRKVYLDEIKYIIKTDRNLIKRSDYQTDISSRNKMVPTKKQKRKNGYVGIPTFSSLIIKETKNGIYFY